MNESNLLRLTFTFLLLLYLTSCSPKLTYSLRPSDNSSMKKVFFGQNKDVITFNMSRWHNGTFFLSHNFSFDKRLIVNMQGVKVWYKNYVIPFSLYGKNYKKDTFHIDGDENILTVFSAHFSTQTGDTLSVKFDDFLQDEYGKEFKFDPIYLIVTPYSKTK